MIDFPMAIAIVADILIACGYIGIGLMVAPRFCFGESPGSGATIAKWCGITFFVTCFYTHLHEAIHIMLDRPYWVVEWHYLVAHILQALSAPAFLVFGSIFLRIYIEGKQPSNEGNSHSD